MKNSQDTLIDVPLLASILNEKNIIQIGSKAYKIDFVEELIYVLGEVNDANMVLLENKDLSSGKIKIYSIDEEVLYLDEGSYDESFALAKKKPKCKEKGAKKRKAISREKYFNVGMDEGKPESEWWDYQHDAKHVYQRAGIFFSLHSEFKYMKRMAKDRFLPQVWQKADTYIEGIWTYKYKKKCQEEVLGTHPYLTYIQQCDNKLVANPNGTFEGRIYAGGRALSKYAVGSEYTFKLDGCDDNFNAPVTVVLDGISYGY